VNNNDVQNRGHTRTNMNSDITQIKASPIPLIKLKSSINTNNVNENTAPNIDPKNNSNKTNKTVSIGEQTASNEQNNINREETLLQLNAKEEKQKETNQQNGHDSTNKVNNEEGMRTKLENDTKTIDINTNDNNANTLSTIQPNSLPKECVDNNGKEEKDDEEEEMQHDHNQRAASNSITDQTLSSCDTQLANVNNNNNNINDNDNNNDNNNNNNNNNDNNNNNNNDSNNNNNITDNNINNINNNINDDMKTKDNVSSANNDSNTVKSPRSPITKSKTTSIINTSSKSILQKKRSKPKIYNVSELELPFYRGKLTVAEMKRGQEEKKIIRKMKLHVGDKVLVKPHDRKGVVKYIGQVHFVYGYVIGLELLENLHGKNSGECQGVQYFECKKGRGLFIKIDSIEKNL